MRRSKLEVYVDILKVLAHTGPQKLTNIRYKANVNSSASKNTWTSCYRKGLIEEKLGEERKVVYVNTQKGISVLKYFREPSSALPTVEEKDNSLSLPY